MSRMIKVIIMLYPLVIRSSWTLQFFLLGVYPQLSLCTIPLKGIKLGEQGWRIGESTPLPPMWPGFESWRRCHMWVEYVAGSLPCSERLFSQYSGFLPLLKNQHFQIPIRSGTHGHVSTSSYELLSAPWVNKLQLQLQER